MPTQWGCVSIRGLALKGGPTSPYLEGVPYKKKKEKSIYIYIYIEDTLAMARALEQKLCYISIGNWHQIIYFHGRTESFTKMLWSNPMDFIAYIYIYKQ